MIFIVSDLHLGKEPASDADSLRELEACIMSSGAIIVVFLGDVFDAFIESGSPPPAAVRLWGEQARRLLSSGITIRYLMGNHDRWHRRFVEDTIGSSPVRHSMSLDWGEQTVHLEHGDAGQPRGPLTTFARWVSDQAWMHSAYTTVLPFGGAQGVAAAVSRRFASFDPNPTTVSALKTHAVETLRSGSDVGVVMGHCHQAGLFALKEKVGRPAWYANSGDWYESRTFVLLSGANTNRPEVRLCAWRQGEIHVDAALDRY